MDWQFSAASWACLASAAVATSATVMLWRRRAMPSATELRWTVTLAAWWAVMAGLELAAVGHDVKIFFSQLSYFGASAVAPVYLLFALRFADPARKTSRATAAIFLALPAIATMLAFTNAWHGWVWTSFKEDPERNLLIYQHGPGFAFVIVYSYLAVFAATGVLLTAAVRARRRLAVQMTLVVVAAVLPLIGNVLYVIGASPLPGVDLGPTTFSLTALCFVIGIYRFGLFRVIPIARELLPDQMADGMVVLDTARLIADVNNAALQLFGPVAPLHLLHPVPALLNDALDRLERREGPECHLTVGTREVEIRSSPVLDSAGQPLGALVLLRDVTARVRAERALADARHALADRVRELEATLSRVKTLEGLLPICAYCKRIRDDSDYWQEVEAYLGAQTGARFTHSVCPSCANKVLQELEGLSGRRL